MTMYDLVFLTNSSLHKQGVESFCSDNNVRLITPKIDELSQSNFEIDRIIFLVLSRELSMWEPAISKHSLAHRTILISDNSCSSIENLFSYLGCFHEEEDLASQLTPLLLSECGGKYYSPRILECLSQLQTLVPIMHKVTNHKLVLDGLSTTERQVYRSYVIMQKPPSSIGPQMGKSPDFVSSTLDNLAVKFSVSNKVRLRQYSMLTEFAELLA